MPKLTEKQALDVANRAALGARVAGKWTMSHLLLSLVILTLLVIGYLLIWKIPRIEKEARSAAFAADSIAAVADTTRKLQLKMFSDSMAAFERRAVQTEIVADAFDKAMKKVSAAVAGIRVHVDTQSGRDTADVFADRNNIRRAEFHIERTPFIADAKVVLPPPPSKGVIDINFALQPFNLGARIQCGDPVLGIKPGTIAIITPPWMQATIENPRLERRICNPEKRTGVSKWLVLSGFVGGVYLGSRFGGK